MCGTVTMCLCFFVHVYVDLDEAPALLLMPKVHITPRFSQLPNQCQNACLPLSGDPKVVSLHVSLNTNLAEEMWPWSAMLTYAIWGRVGSRGKVTVAAILLEEPIY